MVMVYSSQLAISRDIRFMLRLHLHFTFTAAMSVPFAVRCFRHTIYLQLSDVASQYRSGVFRHDGNLIIPDDATRHHDST